MTREAEGLLSEYAAHLLDEGARVAAELRSPDPPFEYEIGIAASYGDALAGRWSSTTSDLDEVLMIARSHGRMIIHAEAGAGKSTFVGRVFRHSLDRGQPSLWVDLRRWAPALYEKWHSRRGEDLQRMALLLESLARPSRPEPPLRRVSREHGLLVVVDGLNEVSRQVSRGILPVLDAFAARNPQASILVTDRLTRRELPAESEQWAIAGITGVWSAEGGDDPNGAHSNALVKDLLLSAQPGETTTVAALEAPFRERARMDPAELDALSLKALEIYVRGLGRMFPAAELDDVTGASDLSGRLIGADLLLLEGDSAYFRHHLFHDFLAARAVAPRPELWNYGTFNAVSFKANAFDPFALVLEELREPNVSDRFVEAVFGWNQYASAYALARGRRLQSVSVSDAAELTVLGMLAERRWDPFRETIDRVEDSLRLFQSELSEALLRADDLRAVMELIAERGRTHPFADEWLPTFLGQQSAVRLIALLDAAPFVGWTASNALRRAPLDRASLDALQMLARGHLDPQVRWRAVHTLGGSSTPESVATLIDRLDQDGEDWVRYGAVRSLVEIAATESASRETVLGELRARLAVIRRTSLVLNEFEQCLVLHQPPQDWPEAVAPLVEDLWAMSDTVFEQDHYRRVGQRVWGSVREYHEHATRESVTT
jgi:hypothetical protein